MSKKISAERLRRLERMSLATAPSEAEVRRNYASLLQRWEIARQSERQPAFGKLQQLWMGMSLRLMEGMSEFTSGLKELGGPVYATRELVGGAASQRVFIRKSGQCLGRLAVSPAKGNRVDLEFSLRDAGNHPIQPFFLTVLGNDGKELLPRKQIDGETYTVRDREWAGLIAVMELPDGSEQVRMGWRVE